MNNKNYRLVKVTFFVSECYFAMMNLVHLLYMLKDIYIPYSDFFKDLKFYWEEIGRCEDI